MLFRSDWDSGWSTEGQSVNAISWTVTTVKDGDLDVGLIYDDWNYEWDYDHHWKDYRGRNHNWWKKNYWYNDGWTDYNDHYAGQNWDQSWNWTESRSGVTQKASTDTTSALVIPNADVKINMKLKTPLNANYCKVSDQDDWIMNDSGAATSACPKN